MKLEYLHGQRMTKLVHEMTPLEMAIHSYEETAQKTIERYQKLAKEHFDGGKTQTDKERESELKDCIQFLELERMKLEKISDVQGQLAIYRESALRATQGSTTERNAAIRRLELEEHHPTSNLEAYMRAEGVPKPSSKHTAHHIVPGKGKDRS